MLNANIWYNTNVDDAVLFNYSMFSLPSQTNRAGSSVDSITDYNDF